MTDTTIEEGWRQFRAMALPADMSATREANERVVFFCGAKFMIETIGKHTSHIIGDHEALQSVKRELTQFWQQFQINRLPTEGNG